MTSLYFAFPDGAFQYVCAECTALCCRNGHLFSANLRQELPRLIQVYPSLASLAVKRRGDELDFVIPQTGCLFLAEDNRCRVQIDHGREMKPSGCRLFPFNIFDPLGPVVAVRPNFLCPLRLVVPPRPGEVEGSHALIEAAVREGDLPRAERGSKVAEMDLEREIGFRDLCTEMLGTGRFADALERASASSTELRADVERAAAILGAPPQAPTQARDEIDDVLLAIAPTLRLSLLGLRAEAVLAALALGERVLRGALELRGGSATPQLAWDVLRHVGPALRLLARGREPLGLPARSAKQAPPFGDPEMAFAGYRVSREAGTATATLDVLESAMERLTGAADRQAFLVQIGAHLESKRKRAPRAISFSPPG